MSYFLLPQIPATSLASSLLVLFVCYLLGTGLNLGARAQSLGLPHDCANSSYSWMYNTEGEPPCALATDLLRPCGDLINGPTLLNTPCICNSVLYSLDSACRWCSNEPDTILKFTDFADSFSCTNTVEGQYPETIPPGTPIPAWAYLPLTGDQFDIAGAEQMMLSPGKDPVVPSGPGGNSSPADSSTLTTTSGGSASTTTIVTQHTPSTSGSSQHSSSTSSPAAPGSSESTSSDTSGTNTNNSHNNTTTNSHPSTGNASSNTTTTSSSADGTSTTSNQRTTPASSSPTATNGSNEPSPLPGLPTVAGNASTMTPTGGPGKQSSNHVAAVVGGAAGGLCAVAVLIALGLFLVRRRRRRHDDGDHGRGIGRRLSRRRRGLPFGPQLETSATQQLRGDDQGVSPTFVFKLYNPDDPSTYPPPLSEIHSDSKLSTYPGGYLEISDAVKV